MRQDNADRAESGRVGRLDRIIRLGLAGVLLGFALICPFARDLGAWAVWGSGAIGAVLLITALLGRCPAYRALGIRT